MRTDLVLNEFDPVVVEIEENVVGMIDVRDVDFMPVARRWR